ncbi:MAG TPA: MbcA/ParS/Xre antitoxin family protein [Terracidiphilus sp.]
MEYKEYRNEWSALVEMATLSYPITRYSPPEIVDLSSKEERERLSASGLKALFNIAARWKLRAEDVRELLGGVANGSYFEMKKNPESKVLDADQMFRISYLIGIFKALHILHNEQLADEWVKLANSNRIFGGRTPLEYMTRGGVPAMQVVRRLLDARRGGM